MRRWRRAFDTALDTLRGLGAEVCEVEIPSIDDAPALLLIIVAEAFAYHEQDIREHPELYGEVLRERILAGALVTAAEYTQAQRLRTRLCHEMATVLQQVEVLATPTTTMPATLFTQAQDPAFGFPRSNMMPFNATGLPTLALPCGMAFLRLTPVVATDWATFRRGDGTACRARLRAGHTLAYAAADA